MRTAMRIIVVVVVCACAMILAQAQADPFTLHAAQLSPALSLLSWSAPSPSRWLSLSLGSHSASHLSLPPDVPSHLIISGALDGADAASVAFTLCEHHSDQRDGSPSSSSPLCAHATLPALHSSAATADSAAPRWDLDGARLSAEVTRSPVDLSSHRISWSAARVSSDAAAPPLLYSLFAEWSAHTIDAKQMSSAADTAAADSATPGAASPQPTLQRHSVRMCSAQSDEQRTQQRLHCDVPADRLPRGAELTLHLLTECDYQTINAEGATSLPHCLSAVSPEMRVTLPLESAAVAQPLVPHVSPLMRSTVQAPVAHTPVALPAAPGVARVANADAVREALCGFYNQTNGDQWFANTGWCDPTMPLCTNGTQQGWFGIGCDATSQAVTALQLSNNNLAASSGLDLSPLLAVLGRLKQIDLGDNPDVLLLPGLDASALSDLQFLSLRSLASPPTGFQPLRLPSPTCVLSTLRLSYTAFVVDDWTTCARLVILEMDAVHWPWPLATITLLPELQQFSAGYSALTGEPVGAYGGGLAGGELTLFILANLNESNPLLQALDLTGCNALPFGLANATDNFPSVNAPLLTSLSLTNLRLRTGPLGPANLRWLEGMPSLTRLGMNGLATVTMTTESFLYASRSLQSWACDCPILGDLSPLYSLPIVELILSGSGLRSQLPQNVSHFWPRLSTLECSGCNLQGTLPSFRHLPALQMLYLDRNALIGLIATDLAAESPLFEIFVVSSNQLSGPLPSFCASTVLNLVAVDSNNIEEFPDLRCYGTVQTLQLQSNTNMRGQLPADIWQRLPQISILILSNTQLNGSIPDRDPTLPSMSLFLASNAEFSGSLPLNIDAAQIDLSNNRFHGPLILFDDRFTAVPQLNSLTLASAGKLSCPIQLSTLVNLVTLVLSGDGFDGCSWPNVTLPSTVTQLDISSCNWHPWELRIPPTLVTLRAVDASITGILIDVPSLPLLDQLTLDANLLSPSGNSQGDTVVEQLSFLLNFGTATALRSFSAQRCGLDIVLSDLLPIVSVNAMLEVLNLDSNGCWGSFAGAVTANSLHYALPPRLTQLSLANNTGISGLLPVIDHQLAALRSVDFSFTALAGSFPASWGSNLPALTQLNIANSGIRCELVISNDGRLQCSEQHALTASHTIAIESDSLADPAAGVHCYALIIASTGSSGVTADPAYHFHTDCRCDANSFGLNARCYRCPEGCTCEQDKIQNCFPVIQRGSMAVAPAADSSGSRSVTTGSIASFVVTAILPCPRTVTGASLCNPDGISWPSFYRIIERTGSALVSDSLTDSDTSSPSDFEIDLSDWCYPGHTGRLYAACSSGYFSSGRWCLKCLSEGVHVMILVANLLLIIALIAYLYVKSPGAVNAGKSLQLYSARLLGSSIDAASRSMRALRDDGAASANIDASESFSGQPAADVANPLKLLIFHSQQLSLLLLTSTSLPAAMTGLLSVMSSGSTGFSLSSLIAMECLSSKWTLSARCWAVICAPALVGLVAVVAAILSRKRGADSRSMQLQGRNEPLLAAESETDAAPSLVVPRIYSVCLSLLYFLFFPCAQTVLSAVACTDTRESDRSYLNLFPTQSCDDEWRRTILPPAVIGLMFWIVAFPLGSTMMLMKLRARVAASSDSDSAPASAAPSASSASALSVWPVCSDLLLPYSPRFWFWEQLLLLRRLLLVGAVTIIPSSSLYLPLVLFAIIQLSALQQHWAQPYAHSLLNAGELASLYLLLINYISAIILQSGLTDGGFHATADGWAVTLFLVNAGFLLVLVLGLFAFGRQWLSLRCSALRSK